MVQSPTAATGVVGLSEASGRVARALLQGGPATATELAEQLGLSSVAVRRHLDSLIERGYVESSEQAPFGPRRRLGRGRGRPARFYSVTARGRDAFESSYDDVAVEALRFLRERFGDEAVAEFARQRAATVVQRYREAVAPRPDAEQASKLADLLTDDGFAASVEDGPLGLQVIQHHCPVAHVAEEFPQFCEAEREAFSELLGVRVTRLSTLATGGAVCTSVIPTHALRSTLQSPQQSAPMAERSAVASERNPV